MPTNTVRSVLRDRAVVAELSGLLGQAGRLSGRSLESAFESYEAMAANPGLEAIVLLHGRPALLVQDGTFEVPASDTWRGRLYPTRSNIERAIRSVGRVEVVNHRSFSWLGTAWMVADGIAVTNRHVASEFARATADGFSFLTGADRESLVGCSLDFGKEYARMGGRQVNVQRVIYMSGTNEDEPDIAILELASGEGLEPIPLLKDFDYSDRDRYIGAIGYPAIDYRNPAQALSQVFGSIYDVKRFSPGSVSDSGDDKSFTHDCSTLGGSSGSVLIDVETGNAVGLHFAGQFEVGNYGVKVAALLDKLTGPSIVKAADITLTAPSAPDLNFDIAESRPEDLRDRAGFDTAFLTGFQVPLPKLSEDQERHAAVLAEPKPGRPPYILDYEKFSVAMNGTRRSPYFTAVNIDGREARNMRRGGRETWYYDLRIRKDQQVGDELYRGTDLDRGHLVRRLDPVWGEFEEATRAERDTFHFTNCSPQHSALNRRSWLALEDYVLSNATREDLRIVVFTGPVLRPDDAQYRGFQLPRRFWKIVVMVTPEGKLSATAYELSQADLLSRMEFVYGQYETYQVSLGYVEQETDITFGDLGAHDPLGRREGLAARVRIDDPSDIRL